jgi:WS/DGAT/MGAT family acyltransferase
MAQSHYDRLSALDASFLEIEDHNCHMHIGSVGLYDAAPLTRPEGGLDIERISTFLERQMHKSERFRQKLATIPRLDHPVWIDDHTFNIHYHVRHTALPAPGDMRLLKRLAGRIMSQQLDRGKPLWETWFVEGVEGDRFAVISKVHHCLADGIGGTDLVTSAMGTSPDYVPEPGPPWQPRPAPSQTRLLVDELSRRAALPLDVARAGMRALSEPTAALDSLRDTATDLSQAAAAGFGSASETPLNQPIGPHRRFDWNGIDLAKVKEIRKRMDVKVNDVVLAVVSGAVRDFLDSRGVALEGLDFRAMVPVSVRNEDERGTAGNRVSSIIVPLPVDELDPLKRLRRVAEITRELKASGQSRGMQAISELMEFSGTLTQRLARAARESNAANLVVTNVPGPPVPIYMLGARLLEAYPLVPLAGHQALGVALFSYAGGLYWGFNADWDRVPDLHDFALSIGSHFEALAKAVDEGA